MMASFSTKKNVENVINSYSQTIKNKKKTLVICHGKVHKTKFKNSLLLNKRKNAEPNIVLNAWNDEFMKYLPKEYFDTIIMEHCPLSNPFDKRHNILWSNLRRILKKGGKIINSSILALYSKNVKGTWYRDMKLKDKKIVKGEVDKYLTKLKFKNIKHTPDKKRKGSYVTTMIK